MKNSINKFLYEKLTYIAAIAFPILFISTPRATTALATLLAGLCIFSISNKYENIFKLLDIKLITTAFFSYVIAIILTQLTLKRFTSYEFQQQGRLLLLLPFFYHIYNKKMNLAYMATFAIPLACIMGTLSSMYVFQGSTQWGGRQTVQHIDPLNFGYLMLFLAFSSLLIAVRWGINKWHQFFCGIAFICGIYMSIKSGSRTGWLAIPLVSFWIMYSLKKIKFHSLFIVLTAIICIALILYFLNENFHSRADDFTKGFSSYDWDRNPSANDTSVGVRISMLRMGWYCFTQAPWFGFGSGNLYDTLNISITKTYATESTIKFASVGFMHNEFLTQLVKHGVFGGFAYLFILFCITRIYKKSRKLKISSPTIDVFVIYIIFAVIASLSTEILIVKPMILFFGFMLACFAGETLWRIHEVENTASSIESIKVA